MNGREWAEQHVEQAQKYAETHVDCALRLLDAPEKDRETLARLFMAVIQDGAATGYNAGREAGYWEGMCDQ